MSYLEKTRWFILILGSVVMVFISIYQYSWTIFSSGILRETKWGKPTVDAAYVVFSHISTFIQPISGYLIDTVNPYIVSLTGASLTSLGLLLCSTINTPLELYVYYGLGSIGVGVLYGATTALAIRLFPDRRGLATGVVTFGFGAGASLYNVILDVLINTRGFRESFIYIGLITLSTLIPLSTIYRYLSVETTGIDVYGDLGRGDLYSWKWREMMSTWQWWLIYFSMITVSSIPLMLGSQLKSIASEHGIPLTALYLALTVYPVANGLSRLIGGWVSDRIGRQSTMSLFYSTAGLVLLSIPHLSRSPLFFVLSISTVALLTGAVFSFTPSIISDFYGVRYVTVNYGITYTAKAWGGFISSYVLPLIHDIQGTFTNAIIGLGLSVVLIGLLVNPKILGKPIKK